MGARPPGVGTARPGGAARSALARPGRLCGAQPRARGAELGQGSRVYSLGVPRSRDANLIPEKPVYSVWRGEWKGRVGGRAGVGGNTRRPTWKGDFSGAASKPGGRGRDICFFIFSFDETEILPSLTQELLPSQLCLTGKIFHSLLSP